MKIIGRTQDYLGVYYRILSEELQEKIKMEAFEIQLKDFIENIKLLVGLNDINCIELDFLDGYCIHPKLVGLKIDSNTTNEEIKNLYPFLVDGVYVKLDEDKAIKVKLIKSVAHSTGSFDILIHIQHI